MTFIVLISFTEKGVADVKASPERAAAFRSQVEAEGGTVSQVYWTVGRYDGVLVMDMPDSATATAVLLKVASQGNVRTETLTAFDAKDFEQILQKL